MNDHDAISGGDERVEQVAGALESTVTEASDADRPRDHHVPRVVWMVVLLITLLSLAIRIYDLGGLSLRSDEIEIVNRAFGRSSNLDYGNGAALFPIVRAAATILGPTDAAVRLPSAVFGMLSVVVMFLVGRRWFGIRVGVVAALFLAVSPLSIHYSREAHSYSLFMLVALISYWLLPRVALGGRWWPSIVLGGVLGGATLAHLFGVFVLVGTASSVLVGGLVRGSVDSQSPSRLRSLASGAARSATVAVVALVVAMPVVLQFLQPLARLMEKLIASSAATQATAGSGSGLQISPSQLTTIVFDLATYHTYSTPLAGLFWAFFAIGTVVMLRRFPDKAAVLLVLILASLPTAVAFSNISGLGWSTRRIIFVLPLFTLVVGVGASSLQSAARALWIRVTRIPAPGWVSGLVGVTLVAWPCGVIPVRNYFHGVQRHAQHWREAAEILSEVSARDDTIIIWPDRSLRYYFRDQDRLQFVGDWADHPTRSTTTAASGQWFVILDFISKFEPERALLVNDWIADNGFLRFQFDTYIWMAYRSPGKVADPDLELRMAEKVLTSAVEKLPGNQKTRLALGEVYARAGEVREALSLYASSDGTPLTADAYLDIARAVASSDPDIALDLYDRCLEADPTCYAAYVGRIRLLAARGDLRAAERDLRQVRRARPDPAASVELSEILEGMGRSDEAASLVADARDRGATPERFRLTLHLAGLLGRMGRFDEARAELATAQAMLPSSGAERLWSTLTTRDEVSDILRGLEPWIGRSAGELEGGSVVAGLRLRQAQLLASRPSSLSAESELGAVVDDGAVARQTVDYVEIADRLRVRASGLMRQGRVEEASDARRVAISIYEQAVHVDPERFGVQYLTLGRLLSDEGRHAEAVSYLTRATARNPQDVEAWANLCLAFERADDRDDAIEACGKARALKPEHFYVNAMLTDLFMKGAQWEAMIPVARAAVESSPSEQQRLPLLLELAQALAATGRRNEACEIYAEANASTSNPEATSAWTELGCGASSGQVSVSP